MPSSPSACFSRLTWPTLSSGPCPRSPTPTRRSCTRTSAPSLHATTQEMRSSRAGATSATKSTASRATSATRSASISKTAPKSPTKKETGTMCLATHTETIAIGICFATENSIAACLIHSSSSAIGCSGVLAQQAISAEASTAHRRESAPGRRTFPTSPQRVSSNAPRTSTATKATIARPCYPNRAQAVNKARARNKGRCTRMGN